MLWKYGTRREQGATRRGVGRNAASLLVSRVVAATTATVAISLAAHRLDADDFGTVASVLAAGFVANTVVTFGSDTVVTRAVARAASGTDEPTAPTSTTGASLRLQTAIAAAFVVGALVAFMSGAPFALLVQALSLIPLAVVTVSGSVLRGRETMGVLATSSLLSSAVVLASVFMGFALSSDPAVPVAAFALGALTAALVQRRASGPLGFATGTGVGPLVREAAPFATTAVLAAVAAQGGVLMVELLSSAPTGGYGAAVRVLEAARLVPAAVVGALFPRIVSDGNGARGLGSGRWAAGLAGYALVMCGAVVLAAPLIDELLFDRQPDGVAALRLLALSLPLVVARLALSSIAIARGRERTVLASTAAGTLVLIGGGVLVVDRHGIPGVATAQVAGVAVSVVWLAIDRRRA